MVFLLALKGQFLHLWRYEHLVKKSIRLSFQREKNDGYAQEVLRDFGCGMFGFPRASAPTAGGRRSWSWRAAGMT